MTADLGVTADTFQSEVLESEVPVLVDFWAEWCGPCMAIGPAIVELATEYAGKAKVLKVNVDEERAIAERYGIMSIPALLVFKGGKLVDQVAGARPKAQIAQLIDRHL